MDIRYNLLLIPLMYVLLPYIFNGNFILLGILSGTTVLMGIIIFIIITNLNIGADIGALTVGGGANFDLNNEGSYSLFVVCIGGLFYFGAQLVTLFTPIINIVMDVVTAILYIPAYLLNVNLSAFSTTTFSSLGLTNLANLGQWYNTNYKIAGISIFYALDVIMALCFVLGLWLMISSRGH